MKNRAREDLEWKGLIVHPINGRMLTARLTIVCECSWPCGFSIDQTHVLWSRYRNMRACWTVQYYCQIHSHLLSCHMMLRMVGQKNHTAILPQNPIECVIFGPRVTKVW